MVYMSEAGLEVISVSYRGEVHQDFPVPHPYKVLQDYASELNSLPLEGVQVYHPPSPSERDPA